MDKRMMLKYAYYHALDIWIKADEKSTESPDDLYLEKMSKKAWKDLKEIERLLSNYERRYERK